MKKIIILILVMGLLSTATPTIMSVEETIEDKQRIDSDDLKTETIHF